MPQFDLTAVGNDALAAATAALKLHVNHVHPFLEAEARKLAETGRQIAQGVAVGDINEAQAKILLRMQGNASQAVLTTVETITMIAAQDAINAALGVVRTAVNKAIGIAIL
jgi:hypothetical protein